MLNIYQKILILFLLIELIKSYIQRQVSMIENISQQLSKNAFNFTFSVKTIEGLNMDCLKMLKTEQKQQVGVFHSSIEQKTSGYNALYFAKYDGQKWRKISKLSERGSQGIVYQIQTTTSFLVLYELQNHGKGNTIAIRYYDSISNLQKNFFLYQYQLFQINSHKKVINIGTPSIDEITLIQHASESKFNQSLLKIRYHWCPDGQNDYPGQGQVIINPLRDFTNQQGSWIGGCKEDYQDWSGFTSTRVLNAIRKIGVEGKIGQRDVFQLAQEGNIYKFYLYEANIKTKFDWKNWRIILYSQNENRAIEVPFVFNKVIDIANPHISNLFFDKDQEQYLLWISFFLPGEGIQPDIAASSGEFTALTKIKM